MTAAPIPDEVKRFILLAVPSVPYLEAMLLFRAEEAKDLSAATVSRRLYLPEAQAAELIRQLSESQVVAASEGGTWRYAPDEELRSRIDAVAHAYSTNLIGVAQLIHSKSDRRAAQFAEAFKIRRDA